MHYAPVLNIMHKNNMYCTYMYIHDIVLYIHHITRTYMYMYM